MNTWIYTLVAIVLILLFVGIYAIVKNKKLAEIREKNPGYPKGYWMNQGMAIGIAIGAGVGVALGNLAIGVGMGVAIGAAIGSGLEKQHKDEIRPITEEETKLSKQTTLVAIGTLALGIIMVVILFLLRN